MHFVQYIKRVCCCAQM